MDDMSRRAVLAAPVSLALISSATACAQEASAPGGAVRRSLVVYLTRSGNTRVLAGTIERALHADLFHLQAVEPYPADYEAHVERARVERDRGIEPRLAGKPPEIGG